MKIVTAANYRMRRFALSCVKSAKKLGYSVIVYDLGGLGFGKPFTVNNETFQKKGFYREIRPARYSHGNHKAQIIKDSLRRYNEFIVYLDADAILVERIDEVIGDYDIGITVRPEWEVEWLSKFKKRYFEKLGQDASKYFIYDSHINDGVMFFNATDAAYRFVEEWGRETERLESDQGAVNSMLQEYFPLKSGQLIERQGIRIRTFDTLHYNYSYFRWPEIHKSWGITENDIKIKWQEAKILHFKGIMRSEYLRIFHPFRFYFTRAISECLSMPTRPIKAIYRWFVRVFKGKTSILGPLYKLSKKLKEKSTWYRRFVAFIKGKR